MARKSTKSRKANVKGKAYGNTRKKASPFDPVKDANLVMSAIAGAAFRAAMRRNVFPSWVKPHEVN